MKVKSLRDKEIFQNFLKRGEPPLDYERGVLKTEFNKKRVLSIIKGKIIPPYEVEIQPTSICNLRCKHCFGRNYDKLPNKIGKKEFKILADRIGEFKEGDFEIEVVKFCGTTGEPLVNPYTVHALNLFKNLGKTVILFTNGVNLDKPIGNSGLKYYNAIAKIDKLVLSLDAGSEEIFYNLKGTYGFNRIIKSLEEIAKIRDEEKTGIYIRVSYVIGELNLNDIVNATKIVKKAGADCISFRVDFTNEEKIREISDKIIENIKLAKSFEDDSFKVISVYSNEEIVGESCAFNSKGIKCFNQNIWACIGPDCELYACGHRTYSGVKSYGNLLKNSFREIWTSKERQEAIKLLPDVNCKNCSPFSKRINDFLTFLSGLENKEMEVLIKNVK